MKIIHKFPHHFTSSVFGADNATHAIDANLPESGTQAPLVLNPSGVEAALQIENAANALRYGPGSLRDGRRYAVCAHRLCEVQIDNPGERRNIIPCALYDTKDCFA